MLKPPLDYRLLRDQVSVLEVLRIIGWTYTSHRGDDWRGPCPVHGSRSLRSRSLRVQGHYWYCHVCKRGGDALEIWAQVHKGMAKLESAYELCAALGIDPPRLVSR